MCPFWIIVMINDHFNNTLPNWVSRNFFREEDLDRYAALSKELLITPTQMMLEFCDGGRALVDRYNRDKPLWKAFRQAVTQRHTTLPAWQGDVRIKGYRIESLVELAVYRRIERINPQTISVMVQPSVRESAVLARADFGLYVRGKPTLYVEVVGTVTRDGRSISANAETLRNAIEERLLRYVGTAPVEILHIDEVCDPAVLTARLEQAFARAQTL
ncbi:hypothetical protein APA22_18790 [Acetobacter pasteurianus IFO 3283-22]|uniref:Uncharacterized protein n=2 Tax=Acetobacter pasteurianus TaxID=438 RepID=C7JCH6_ACEP3|nr:hypothetical protein DB34_00295 [Acetobacter pasteurianus]BAI00005.1 hypothetical protein APA01_18790 [Acetobacter pasteurianus IFO 3283-01]BAI03058.1 hypothetical protein APA03_18790 [Acetobacter pasteurianus IFO 3283-03]BAI06103.1 hypothetical protein APA07_18790 [Acetobacter pasteurianus IFO 3283-07]BAI09153.1 hypothetical protein APA22_18790 [Acetobacter pasteurianus IFO 3283-22]BAI12201.1 hypothetical protein APA26_18790 [Acetobacter pasteurianus IFO 3283-26]BAI15247.1 hypothetical pr